MKIRGQGGSRPPGTERGLNVSEGRQNKLTYNEVRYRQALPYEIKIRMSETRLREFIGYYGEDGVAVSFSGGLDSTFALAFIRERYPRVKAVSVLAIECKQNIDLIRKTENVQPIPPRYSQKQVIEKFGFPIVSKKVAKAFIQSQEQRARPWKNRGRRQSEEGLRFFGEARKNMSRWQQREL